VSSDRTRQGAYHGSRKRQTSPNAACASVSPTEKAGSHQKDEEGEGKRAGREAQRKRQRAERHAPEEQAIQRPLRHEGEDEEGQRHRRRAAGKIMPGRQKQDMAAVGGMGERLGGKKEKRRGG
jgi:hypothetical protein